MDHSPQPAPPHVQPTWRRADRLFRSGDAAGAMEAYQAAAEGLDDPRLLLRIGRCHHTLNAPNKARHAYARALEKHPKWPAAWLMLGLAYYDEGDLPRAASFFQRVLEDQPDNHVARNMQALIHYVNGDRTGAMGQWDQGLTLSADVLARILVVLEKRRLETPADSDALAAEGDAASPSPSGATPPITRSFQRLMAFCRRAVARKDYAAARQGAERLAIQWPHSPDSHFAVGYVALEMERYDAALAAFRRSIRFQRHADLRRMAGPMRKVTRAFIHNHRKDLTVEPFIQSLQALALIRLGRPEDASALLRDLPVMGPETYGKFYALALCALAEGQTTPARQLFEYALDHFAVDTLELSVASLMDWARRNAAP